MDPQSGVRLDKWLWAVRLYKSRNLAGMACRAGHVRVNGDPAKPSHTVRVGELITAKTGDIERTVRVIGMLERRVGAKLVPQAAEDLTPPSEYAKRRVPPVLPLFQRPQGAGRPSKKQRRELDSFRDENI